MRAPRTGWLARVASARLKARPNITTTPLKSMVCRSTWRKPGASTPVKMFLKFSSPMKRCVPRKRLLLYRLSTNDWIIGKYRKTSRMIRVGTSSSQGSARLLKTGLALIGSSGQDREDGAVD